MSKKRSLVIRAVSTKQMTINLPYYTSGVSAGFPSPADDYKEARLSLDEMIIRNRSATFYVTVEGHSMTGAGIYDKDILVVDRSQKAKLNDVIVAVLDNEFVVKRFVREDNQYYLKAEHEDYPPIPIDASSNVLVWGVVIKVIHDPHPL